MRWWMVAVLVVVPLMGTTPLAGGPYLMHRCPSHDGDFLAAVFFGDAVEEAVSGIFILDDGRAFAGDLRGHGLQSGQTSTLQWSGDPVSGIRACAVLHHFRYRGFDVPRAEPSDPPMHSVSWHADGEATQLSRFELDAFLSDVLPLASPHTPAGWFGVGGFAYPEPCDDDSAGLHVATPTRERPRGGTFGMDVRRCLLPGMAPFWEALELWAQAAWPGLDLLWAQVPHAYPEAPAWRGLAAECAPKEWLWTGATTSWGGLNALAGLTSKGEWIVLEPSSWERAAPNASTYGLSSPGGSALACALLLERNDAGWSSWERSQAIVPPDEMEVLRQRIAAGLSRMPEPEYGLGWGLDGAWFYHRFQLDGNETRVTAWSVSCEDPEAFAAWADMVDAVAEAVASAQADVEGSHHQGPGTVQHLDDGCKGRLPVLGSGAPLP